MPASAPTVVPYKKNRPPNFASKKQCFVFSGFAFFGTLNDIRTAKRPCHSTYVISSMSTASVSLLVTDSPGLGFPLLPLPFGVRGDAFHRVVNLRPVFLAFLFKKTRILSGPGGHCCVQSFRVSLLCVQRSSSFWVICLPSVSANLKRLWMTPRLSWTTAAERTPITRRRHLQRTCS